MRIVEALLVRGADVHAEMPFFVPAPEHDPNTQPDDYCKVRSTVSAILQAKLVLIK